MGGSDGADQFLRRMRAEDERGIDVCEICGLLKRTVGVSVDEFFEIEVARAAGETGGRTVVVDIFDGGDAGRIRVGQAAQQVCVDGGEDCRVGADS